jgi:phosphopantetheine adenylyltransferase
MDLAKYKNDGWGISMLGFTKLLDLIKNNNNKELNVLEFGSGVSTMFLSDVVRNDIKKLKITSFDNDIIYGYKKSDDEDHIKLLVRGLVECDDMNYQKQLSDKKYDKSLMKIKTSYLEPTQKNNFYDIQENDLDGIYDLIILDGPNGNGRNFSFLHIQNHVKEGTFIFIDDYNHYDFLERCQNIFNTEIVFQHTEGIGNDNFVIVKIK